MNLTRSRVRLLFLFLVLVLLVPLLAAQEKREITVEWIYSDAAEEPARLPRFVWLKNGAALLYDTRKPKAERTLERLNPATGQRAPAVDKDKALANMRALLGEKNAPDAFPWPEAFDDAGRRALYVFSGDLYLLELGTAKFWRLTQTQERKRSARFSPEGKQLAYVRENDLYVYDIATGTEKRLTQDGSETVLNGTLSWVYWEEIFGRADLGYWWSEDSTAIAFLRTDESPVSAMHYVDFAPATPRVIQQRYPKAGETNPIVRLGVVELADGRTVWLDASEIPYEYIVRAKWLPDSRRLSFQTLNRMQTRLDLYFMDRATGQAAHILSETDPGWVNIHDDLYFLADGEHFIWSSERDGYAHLYRYTLEGKLVTQVTKGPWSIRSSGGPYWLRQGVTAIDEGNGWLYFTALEKSSLERHLYRIRLDGTGMQGLTRENGTHRVNFSPDARYYFDAYSSRSTLPSLSLYAANGNRVSVLAPPRSELLAGFDLQYPEFFTIPADDGFAMPAEILKPKGFDPKKKYPVIFHVYGGPSAPTVGDAWGTGIYFDQVLLRNGYLVMRVDNRSATAISKKLENTVAKDFWGSGELKDLVAAVRWAKSQPYVDPERIGIWGWSGGGTFTLLAMTGSKEFKAGIAVAAVTDWHYYDTVFTEAHMKRPTDNADGYEKTSLVKKAKDLQGRLLLVHGTYDDNVHPQNAWHFADELIKAGKMFEMMMYPMRMHEISDRPARIHLFKTMLEFWKRNL